MIVDSHEHVILPSGDQIDMMDRAGIDRTVLFPTTPHPETMHDLAGFEHEFQILDRILGGDEDTEKRRAVMRRTIGELRAAIKAHPDRFLGFGPTPISAAYTETCVWIEKEILPNGLIGLGEISAAGKTPEHLEILFRAAHDHNNLPLWFHTFAPVTANDLRALATLCGKYPTVPVVFGHMGGTNWLETLHLAKDLPNVWLDLSASYTLFQPYYAMRELPERTLFSSDAPYGDPALCLNLTEKTSPGPEVTRLVLGDNFLRLIGQ